MANARNLLVINDEAHHAWRVNWEAEGKYLRSRDMKDSAEEATVWIGGLDRLHRSRGILTCYDFSATPFTPSGKKSSEEALFGWIVSDFGLNDAIESGLVKTPRVVVRDDAVPDAKTYKSRLYHIYNDPDVKDDLNRKAEPEEPLPDLVLNAYYLLGYDWREASDAFVLDDSNHVAAWAKNDHLGFEVLYVYRGAVRKYRPDFLVWLTNGEMLVLETKGQDTEQDKIKRR
jgi:type III restriction enzyme